MAALSLHVFENIEDEKEFIERRFHKSIMFMHGVSATSPYGRDSKPVSFYLYRVAESKSFAAIVGQDRMQKATQLGLNLNLVREWTLIRRGSNVFYVGESSEAVIADNVIPAGIRVEGGKDAERCWASN